MSFMKKVTIGVLLLAALFMNGCSAVMALQGDKDPNLAVIQKGNSKAVVEGELRSPIHTEQLDSGNIISTYQYTIGNEPSAGRAAVYVLLDLGTCFISELLTMPLEMAFDGKGETRQIKVEYTREGEIIKIS